MLKRTPLFETHQRLGGKLIEFGGWEMPVYYTSIVDEHQAVRNAAGIFDISHMGEVTVSGSAAEAFLNRVLTNDVRKLSAGAGQYSLLCNERGGVIDDLYVFQLSQAVYFLVVNASRVDADVAWLLEQAAQFGAGDSLRLTDASHNYSAVAVQGPRACEFVQRVLPGPSQAAARVARVTDLEKNQIGSFALGRGSVLVSRTGYTGEDGFEIVGEAAAILQCWDGILEAGRGYGLRPCGLGARDTLRTEVCYPLYGHELDENTTPIEAGLGYFVAFDKGEFNGREVLERQKSDGTTKKCIAFKMTGKSAPPRPGYRLWSTGADAKPIGQVVSGTQSPSLERGIGLGYVPAEFSRADTSIEVEIRGRRAPAVVAKKPLYRKAV